LGVGYGIIFSLLIPIKKTKVPNHCSNNIWSLWW